MEKCMRCGRPLKDERSIKRGMGPVCWRAVHGDVFASDLQASDQEWARREDHLKMGGEIDLGVNWRYPIQTEDGWTLAVQMRVSVRYKAGAFEAYGFLYDPPRGHDKEIIFDRHENLHVVYRTAVEAGPTYTAMADYAQKQKSAAARRNTQDVMKMISSILA